MLEVVEAHEAVGRPLGVIPRSLSALVVDVDHGDAAAVWKAVGTPMVALPTRRGTHGYFDMVEGFGNRQAFTLADASGDLIQGPRAYVRLHHDGHERLAEAIVDRTPAPLQYELFRATAHVESSVGTPRLSAREAKPSPFLEQVLPGARNVSLFDAVRFWAYTQVRGKCLDAWVARCKTWAASENRRFPIPLPDSEATSVGYSVATWTSSRPLLDRGSLAQRRRIVKRWHGRGDQRALEWLEARNEAIREAVAGGRSCRVVAADFGLSVRHVRRIAA